jgi:hypothetical protein
MILNGPDVQYRRGHCSGSLHVTRIRRVRTFRRKALANTCGIPSLNNISNIDSAGSV